MAYGDIGSTIDTYEFDTALCDTPHIIHISGDVYAMVYRSNVALDLITLQISDAGQITEPYIDKLAVHATRPYACRIIHVGDHIYAIVGHDAVSSPAMNTASIQSNGQISDSRLDSEAWELYSIDTHAMFSIAPTIILLAYMGTANAGILRTFTISASGIITLPHIDELVFDTWGSPGHCILELNSGVFAMAYHGPADDGWLKTFSVSGSGFISDTTIDGLEVCTDQRCCPTFCHVTGDIYAIAYSTPGWTPHLLTVSIESDGQIGASVIDDEPYHPAAAGHPAIIHIGLGIVVIAYQGDPGTGWISSFQISSGGVITATPISTYNYDPSYAREPAVIHITGDIYAIAYQGPDEDGFLKTLTIETPPVARPHHEMIIGIGP